MVIDLGFQSMNQLLDLLAQARYPLATDDLGIENCADALDRAIEIVVDHDVLVLLDRPQFPQCGI